MLLRPLTRDDVPAWVRLLADAEQVDGTGEHVSAEDLVEDLGHDDYEALGCFVGDDLVGYASMRARGESEGRFKVDLEGAVTPARRGEGFGTALLGAALARADEVHADRRPGLGCTVTCLSTADNLAQRQLLEDAGMSADRWSFGMRTSLDAVPEPPPMPRGYELRACDDELATRMRDAHNAAFTGHHPGFTPWTERTWEQLVTGARSFRRDLSFVALVGDEIVGYVQTAEWESSFEATGRREAYVGKVGVVPAHRGAGIAATLLGHALVAYRAAGYDEAALHVDSHNPTGALGIYERAGFAVETRWVGYALVRPPVS